MSKRLTTRWYIGAWVVYVIALMALVMSARSAQGSSSPSMAMTIEYLVMGIAGIVMLVTWIGALVKLGTERAWGWFAGVLIAHLVGLGIIGMAAYAIAGPEDADLVVTRPSTPV